MSKDIIWNFTEVLGNLNLHGGIDLDDMDYLLYILWGIDA